MKILKIILSLSIVMAFASCDPDNHQHPDVLVGTWASVSNAKESALILTFDGEYVMVKNGSWDYRPFSADCEWEYYMDRDSVLHLSRYYYDSDDVYESEHLVFDMSFSNSYNTLTLYYDPLIGSDKRFTFIRR